LESLSHAAQAPKPGLVFFHSSVSGRCRRVEGFLAQVLQRRRNHDRFRVESLPTLVVVENKQVRARLEVPRGCRDIEKFLAPWLQ
jgi:hypothetical protein